MKIKGSTGKTSRTMIFNWVIEFLIAVNAGLYLIKDLMTAETFAIISFVLLVSTTTGNKILRKSTTGPLHDGTQF